MQNNFIENIHLQAILDIAVAAGEAILTVYNREEGFEVETKSDASPLTIADKMANDIICAGLKKLYPSIPIISEEGKSIAYKDRKDYGYFWCVDPLDGTKEFIKKNGEFTVNIALIRAQTPVLGVIYVPVQGKLYYGSETIGSWKQLRGEAPQQIKAVNTASWTAAVSRSHADGKEKEILSQYPVTNAIAVGSSLKFCLLAEGKAQIYLRTGPTMEWDTAAGHAIILFSGCSITALSGKPMLYNKESLLNEGFLCKVD
ncbi:3'-5'-bisphosphate nucleotidase [Pedobacter kyungheensis]|uniref:3'(2'),5'-bisphosphate nucleotidase CysQ n=1 Tax=Pedobacter kyungheensis TaxID=1069985 RepID=A0A0C1FRA7_9SPHI|nr:3'(2'),5'-bisphosphate nucleotidase CysQ [Pedobacter kyungheensis]KIA94298.1 3'-5'-bisphosphate nucleotidase [Pedobacter kyungheensis]